MTTPQVGHRVRHRREDNPDFYIEVTGITARSVVGVPVNSEFDYGPGEHLWPLSDDWVQVIVRPELPDMPNRWARIYKAAPSASGPIFVSAADALAVDAAIAAAEYAPTGVIVWPDAERTEVDQ